MPESKAYTPTIQGLEGFQGARKQVEQENEGEAAQRAALRDAARGGAPVPPPASGASPAAPAASTVHVATPLPEGGKGAAPPPGSDAGRPSREVVPPTIYDNATPGLRSLIDSQFGNLNSQTPSPNEGVVRLAAHLHNQFDSPEEADTWIQKVLQNPGMNEDRRSLLTRGLEMSKILNGMYGDQEVGEGAMMALTTDLDLQQVNIGPPPEDPADQYRINFLTDPETGKAAIDINKEFQELRLLHYQASVKKAGYQELWEVPDSIKQAHWESAANAASEDLWRVAAAARDVMLLDSRKAVQEQVEDLPPGLAEVAAFTGLGIGEAFGKRTTSSAFNPKASELEEEGSFHWLLRMGLMDGMAPWLKELRVSQMGLPITDEEKSFLDQVTAMRLAGVPFDDSSRQRVIDDYMHNYLMMDEMRQWVGVSSYLTGKLLGDEDESARVRARKLSETTGVHLASAIPYFFDIDLFVLGTMGLGYAGSKIARTAQVARAIRAAKAMENIVALPGSTAARLAEVAQVSPAAERMLKGAVNARVRKELEVGIAAVVEETMAAAVTSGKLDESAIAAARARMPEDIAQTLVNVSKAEVDTKAAVEAAKVERQALMETLGAEAKELEAYRRTLANVEKWEGKLATLSQEAPDLHRIYRDLAVREAQMMNPATTADAQKILRDEVAALVKEKKTALKTLRETNPDLYKEYLSARRNASKNRSAFNKVLGSAPDPVALEQAAARAAGVLNQVKELEETGKSLRATLREEAKLLAAAHPDWTAKLLSGAGDFDKGFRRSVRNAMSLQKDARASMSAERLSTLRRAVLTEEATRLASEIRGGVKELTKRKVPILSGGLDFARVKHGLPEDEFTQFAHAAVESVTKHEKTGEAILNSEGWYKRLVDRYGEQAINRAAESAKLRREVGASEHVANLAQTAERILQTMPAAEKSAKGASEAARAQAVALLESIADGARGAPPDQVFLKALEAAGTGKEFKLTGEDLASLEAFEGLIKEEARLLRGGEQELRTVLNILQSDHAVRGVQGVGTRSFFGGYHTVRRFVENLWQSLAAFEKRIGPSAEIQKDILRSAENLTERYSEELIGLVNTSVKKGVDPRVAVIEYLSSTKRLNMGIGSSFLNGVGGKTVYTRARRAVLADPATWAEITAKQIKELMAAPDAVREAGTGINAPLLGLSRLFVSKATDDQARILYHETRRLLAAHADPTEFFHALRKTTTRVLKGDGVAVPEHFAKFDKAETKNLAMGARLFIQGAVYDDVAWIAWRQMNGLLSAEVAADINRFFEAGTGLSRVVDPEAATNAMLKMGLSLNQQSVRQASRAGTARSIRGAATDTRRMIEVSTNPTIGSMDRLFLPHHLRKEIARNMDTVIKELDMFHAKAPDSSASWLRSMGQKFFLAWRKDATTGLLIPNPRYYVFNHIGDWSQVWVEAGVTTASKMALHNFWSLIPGVGRKVQERLAERALKYRGRRVFGTVTETFLNPFANRMWHAPAEEVVELGGRSWTWGSLRQQFVNEGVFDTHLDAELHEMIRKQGKQFENQLKGVGIKSFISNLQKSMEEFGISWQQRQRALLMLQLLDQGKSLKEAVKIMRGGLYDWKHTISLADTSALLGAVPFQRFFWLYSQQIWKAVFEGLTQPNMNTLTKNLTGQSKMARLRQQARIFGDAIPNAFEAYNSDEIQTDLDRERQALGSAMYPEWMGGHYPLMGTLPMDSGDIAWSQRMYGKDYAKTQSYYTLPPVIGIDGLEIGMMPFKGLGAIGLAATGQDNLAQNWAEQATKGFVSMLYPAHREAMESVMESWGAKASVGATRAGEWRVRPEEAMVMSLIMPAQIREDPESGQYYAAKLPSIAFRLCPVWLNRFPTMAKYWLYQNPDSQALTNWDTEMENRVTGIGKALGYFGLGFGGLVREYQTNPQKQMIAKQTRLKFALDRTKEAVQREGQPAERLITAE